jgi:hypothetical protein
MADHLDAPGLTSPAMDARVDITDHYAFQKPGDGSRAILILNVNPLAPTHANEFRLMRSTRRWSTQTVMRFPTSRFGTGSPPSSTGDSSRAWRGRS